MARVSWSKVAGREHWGIVEYVEQHSVRAALRLSEAFEAAADRLALYPQLGRVVPEYRRSEIRELIVENYRLLYRVAGDDVLILTIFHGSRDLTRHLPAGPWDIE